MASPPSSRRGILSKLLLATGVAILSLKNILSRHDDDQQYLEYDKPTTHSHRRALQVISDSTTHGVTIYSPRGAYAALGAPPVHAFAHSNQPPGCFISWHILEIFG